MPGSSFLGDVVAVAGSNGQVIEVAPGLVAAMFPTSATITPTMPFSFPWNGSLVQFAIGDTQPVPADLLAAITAASAPFTTP